MRAIAIALLFACYGSQAAAGIPVEFIESDLGNGDGTWVRTELASVAISGPGQYSSTFTPVSIPFTDQHEAISGATVSAASYSFTDTEFRVDFDHYRERRSSAYSNGAIYFAPGVDADYQISGMYSLAGARDVTFHARLSDMTTGETLFDNQQISSATQNEALTLGENGGDRLEYASLSGSLSGSLYQGHQYQFLYRAHIISTEVADTFASATGYTSISFASAVPEPATWVSLISGLGLLGLVTARRGVSAAVRARA